MFNWLKRKLGITKVEETLSILSKSINENTLSLPHIHQLIIEEIKNQSNKQQVQLSSINSNLQPVLVKLQVIQSGLKTIEDSLFGKPIDEELWESYKKQLDNLVTIITDKFLLLDRLQELDRLQQDLKELEGTLNESQLSNQQAILKFLEEQLFKNNTRLEDKLDIVFTKLNELNKEPLLWHKPIKEEPQSFNLSIKDKNFYRALLNNKLDNIHNLSDIKIIPDTYQIFNNISNKRINALNNKHCYNNAINALKERSEGIYIGIIIERKLIDSIAKNQGKISVSFTPYLHAWNVSMKGEINDYTLGNKASNYVYIGRAIKGTPNLTAEKLEEILRNETVKT